MRVLIIDKDHLNQQNLKRFLEGEFFAVDLADKGDKGVFLARTNEYSVIIVAHTVSGQNGVDICLVLRRAGIEVPILGFASNSDVALRIELFEAGVDDSIGKPFAYRELLMRLYSLVRRGRHIDEETLKADGILLDRRGQKAIKGKRHIPLSRKEYAILELLFRNKGRVVSRNELLEYVWDIDVDPFSTTLESHIFNLRRKLWGKRGKKFIKSLQGRGYIIED